MSEGSSRRSRRTYLAGLASAATCLVAGCSSGSSSPTTGEQETTASETTRTATETSNAQIKSVTSGARNDEEITGDEHPQSWLEITLVEEHQTQKLNLIDSSGRQVASTGVSTGAQTVRLKTASADTFNRLDDTLAPGEYTLAAVSDGTVIDEVATTLERTVSIEEVNLNRETTGMDILLNVDGDLPVVPGEVKPTSEFPGPTAPLDFLHQNGEYVDGTDGTLFPHESPYTVRLRGFLGMEWAQPYRSNFTTRTEVNGSTQTVCVDTTHQMEIALPFETGPDKTLIVDYEFGGPVEFVNGSDKFCAEAEVTDWALS